MNTKEQNEAILHLNGPMMVIAGPGSGKTTVITERVKSMIEVSGVEPSDILVITFTKAAAGEMESRFHNITGNKKYKVRFGTFHSVFFWIVKTAYNLDNSNIISEKEKMTIIDKILKSLSLEYENKEDILSSIIKEISLVKCDLIDIENYYSKNMPENDFRSIYRKFADEMSRMKKIDFDDMLIICYELLKSRKDILKSCRRIFRYILVDEFQDSNLVQYEILKMLAKPDENVFVVGDDDQSVYGFRGARPEIMKQFEKDFKNTKIVKLGKNFRCDRNITRLSAKVIGKNKNRFEKKIISMSPNEGSVNVFLPKDMNEQLDMVVNHIKQSVKDGVCYEKQAVLYRTNIEPRRLAYRLNMNNIPYSINDSMPNIFDSFVVQNVMDYMAIACGDRARGRFLRIINRPSRYIGRQEFMEDPVDLGKLRWRLREKEYAVSNIDKLMCDMKMLNKMRPFAALNYIRKGVGYDDYLKEYSSYRQLDVTEFYDILDEFGSMIDNMTSYGELLSFAGEYREVMKNRGSYGTENRGISLMTMHSAKGLEFDRVYIIDAVEGFTPYKKAKTESELEEERRMFYVAMTRAKHVLNIYAPLMIGSKSRITSRYVREIQKGI